MNLTGSSLPQLQEALRQLGNSTIPQLISERVAAEPNAVAIRYKRGGFFRELTWSAYQAEIRKVAAGGSYLPPALSEGLPRRYTHKGAPTSPLETLSDRELQVLKHLAEGRAGRAIAQELHLSVKTVDTYRARLLAKLELHSTAELIRFALRHGVIEDAW